MLLVVSSIPLFDRASGDLRLFRMLRALAERHEVLLCPVGREWQVAHVGAAECSRYQAAVEGLGVRVLRPGVTAALRREAVDAVLFEFHYNARGHIAPARVYRPAAPVVVDSVDIAYRRLLAKAELTGARQALAEARSERATELAVYRQADLVVTVTEDDRAFLAAEAPEIPTYTIPNIHSLPGPVTPPEGPRERLVFVGAFTHEPNVDAMLYFCREVLPRVVAGLPGVRLSIVGDAPPPAIQALASPHVEVLGYVPDTRPYLEASHISIAPLRFGAGMKGKVGEAMSFALPVVTTTVGAEGFGLTPGEHLLVADDADGFADAILRLARDEALYERVRHAGFAFIRDHYSEVAVSARVHGLIDRLASVRPKRLSLPRRLGRKMGDAFEERVAWRLRQAGGQ